MTSKTTPPLISADQYDPGANDQVLKNKLGITEPAQMARWEKEEQF